MKALMIEMKVVRDKSSEMRVMLIWMRYKQDLLAKLSSKQRGVRNWYIAAPSVGIYSKIEVSIVDTRS